MQATLSKWGNSVGIRIPNLILKDLQLEEGSEVLIEEENNKIVISPKGPKLEDLISQINRDNIHKEIDSGFSVGNEAW